MDFQNKFYASLLSGIVSISGCKNTLPGLQKPEVRAQLAGTYAGIMDGIPVSYSVGKDDCRLQADDGLLFLDILDLGCDNTVDYLNPNSLSAKKNRKNLLEDGEAERFDSLLERGQNLVRLENKVKE